MVSLAVLTVPRGSSLIWSTTTDSPHLRHVSAPLARAGISILYQSSYFTDFLLVKEANFQKASAIFASQGCESIIYPAGALSVRYRGRGNDKLTHLTGQVDPIVQNTASRRRSQLLSPTTPSSLTPHHASSNASPSTEQRQLPPEITVLPSALACIGLSRTSERATFEKVRQLVVWPQQAMMSWKRKSMEEMAIEAASWSTSDLMSPLSSTDLDHRAASRHSEDDVEGHLESDVKRKVKVEQEGRPFMSYTRTEDGASLVSEIRVLKGMFGRNAQGEVLQMTTGGERLSEWSDDESEDWSESDSEEGGEQEIPGTSHHHNHGSIEKQDKSLGSFRCSDRRSSFPFNVHRASSGHSTPTIGLHTPPLEDVHLPFSLPSSPLYENGPRAQDSGEKIQPPKVAQDESIGSKQSRHSKHLSLPLTPRDSPLFSTLQAGDRHGHNATTSSAIPISWCGKTHLSAHAESSATSQNNKGRKRCLQLDLRGVEDEYDGVACPFEDPYHMGQSSSHYDTRTIS